MAFAERRLFQFRVVRDCEQSFQADYILNVVGKQSLQGVFIFVSLVILPQQNGEIAVHIRQVFSINPKLPLASFKPARVAETFQNIPQINVRVVESYIEKPFDERHVKACAVVGHKQIVRLDVALEIAQVLAVDVVKNVTAVIDRYRRYHIPVAESGSFYVEVRD